MTGNSGTVSVADQKTSGLAVSSLVLGILAIVMPVLGLIPAVIALVLGVKAKNRIDASKGSMGGGGLATAGLVCGAVGLAVGSVTLLLLAAIAIPNFYSFSIRAKHAQVESNMRLLQAAAEEFAGYAEGYYPATINTTVEEVLSQFGQENQSKKSIADAGKRDPARAADLNATGNAILPAWLKNPWHGESSGPVVATSTRGKPIWSENLKGAIFYVPVGVEGSRASGYEIHGAGNNDILDSFLSSE